MDFTGLSEVKHSSSASCPSPPILHIEKKGNELLLFPSSGSPRLLRPHNRSETFLVRDVKQSYHFVSALSNCFDPSGVSTNENSNLDYADKRGLLSIEREVSSVGIPSYKRIPAKLYCPQCKVFAKPLIKYQEVSLWQRIFCHRCPSQLRASHCRKCKLLLMKTQVI